MKSRPIGVITGGTSGIGQAIAKRLAADHDLLLVYKRDHEGAKAFLEDLRRQHTSRIEVLSADLATREGAHQVAEFARSTFANPPRVLINAAGHSLQRVFLQFDLDMIEDLVQTHLLGTMRLTRLILPDMYRAKYGRIINFSSIAMQFPGVGRGQVPYATAKAGVEAFTEGLAREVFHRGITVNAIRPGKVATRIWKKGPQPKDLDLANLIPAEDVADLAMYLLSPAARMINGSVYQIDPRQPEVSSIKDWARPAREPSA